MKNIATERDKLNPEFLNGVKHFEASLKSKLTPKRSINQGEYVTGEGKKYKEVITMLSQFLLSPPPFMLKS